MSFAYSSGIVCAQTDEHPKDTAIAAPNPQDFGIALSPFP
jgi:hypothetical protein